MFQIEKIFFSKNEFRQQIWGLGLSTALYCSPENFKKIWGGQT